MVFYILCLFDGFSFCFSDWEREEEDKVDEWCCEYIRYRYLWVVLKYLFEVGGFIVCVYDCY